MSMSGDRFNADKFIDNVRRVCGFNGYVELYDDQAVAGYTRFGKRVTVEIIPGSKRYRRTQALVESRRVRQRLDAAAREERERLNVTAREEESPEGVNNRVLCGPIVSPGTDSVPAPNNRVLCGPIVSPGTDSVPAPPARSPSHGTLNGVGTQAPPARPPSCGIVEENPPTVTLRCVQESSVVDTLESVTMKELVAEAMRTKQSIEVDVIFGPNSSNGTSKAAEKEKESEEDSEEEESKETNVEDSEDDAVLMDDELKQKAVEKETSEEVRDDDTIGLDRQPQEEGDDEESIEEEQEAEDDTEETASVGAVRKLLEGASVGNGGSRRLTDGGGLITTVVARTIYETPVLKEKYMGFRNVFRNVYTRKGGDNVLDHPDGNVMAMKAVVTELEGFFAANQEDSG